MLLSATLDNPRRSTMDGQSITAPHENKLLAALAKGYICRIMKLLVTVSLVLEPEDFGRIGPIVWDRYLCVDDNVDVSTVGSVHLSSSSSKRKLIVPQASFLIMQCAEKTPADIQATIQVDFNRYAWTLYNNHLFNLSVWIEIQNCEQLLGLARFPIGDSNLPPSTSLRIARVGCSN